MSYDSTRPLIVMHVPKSAGVSIQRALVAALTPDRAVSGFDATLFGDFRNFASFAEEIRNLIYLDKAGLPREADFVSGHFSLSTLSPVFPMGQFLTVLREPITRLLSLWLFWRALADAYVQLWGPEWGRRLRLSRGPLAEFLCAREIACQTDNQVVRMLLAPHPLIPQDDFIDQRHDAALVREARLRLKRFDFIDIVENRNLEANLAKWIGRPFALGKDNVTGEIPKPLRSPISDEATPEAAALLDARSRLDLNLWLEVAGGCVPGTDGRSFRRQTIAASLPRYARMMTV
jgi:hypothetical protein